MGILNIPKKTISSYNVKVKHDKSWWGSKTDSFITTHPERYKVGKKIKWDSKITSTVVSITKLKRKYRTHLQI